jgi:uncharacterized membrane protein YhaH (DUF805 family)
MLGFLFGFNARIGRLYYFLATLLLGIVAGFLVFVVAAYYGAVHAPFDTVMTSWPIILIGIAVTWAMFMLHAMRFRDIGWDPVCVIPVWLALTYIDRLIAMKIPAWSLGPHHLGTAFGSIMDAGLFLALLFWPGGNFEAPPPRFSQPPPPAQPTSSGNAGSVTAARIARVGGGFGKRGHA